MKLCSSVENKEALTFSGNGDHDVKSNKSKKDKYQVLFSMCSLWEEKGIEEDAIRDVEIEIERGKGIIKCSGEAGKTKIKHAYMEMS